MDFIVNICSYGLKSAYLFLDFFSLFNISKKNLYKDLKVRLNKVLNKTYQSYLQNIWFEAR